ncbi:uncharacterized protein LOC124373327 [Homalodisca vitripennis]|uniref:uncharacterized protein LOC124373327 n=1 Tax=Homalodisca vitripennis TaxID=197043 RepID=UPI001EECDF25|nr:uncharacterized protein LOC124373327 [Homalodisca vitripennis]
MEFDYEIRHKQGRLHVVPDTLSRNACEDCKPEDEDKTNEIPMLALNWTDLPKLQDEDEECRRIKDTMLKPEESTATERRMARSFMLEDGVLYRRNVAHIGEKKLLVVPESIRSEILYECHDSPLAGGHLGFTKTFHKLKCRFYWPNMIKDTENYNTSRQETIKHSPYYMLFGMEARLPVDVTLRKNVSSDVKAEEVLQKSSPVSQRCNKNSGKKSTETEGSVRPEAPFRRV